MPELYIFFILVLGEVGIWKDVADLDIAFSLLNTVHSRFVFGGRQGF